MNPNVQLTVYICAAAVPIIAAIDIYLLKTRGMQATISSVLYRGAQKYPVIAFGLGFVMGHLFWHNS